MLARISWRSLLPGFPSPEPRLDGVRHVIRVLANELAKDLSGHRSRAAFPETRGWSVPVAQASLRCQVFH